MGSYITKHYLKYFQNWLARFDHFSRIIGCPGCEPLQEKVHRMSLTARGLTPTQGALSQQTWLVTKPRITLQNNPFCYILRLAFQLFGKTAISAFRQRYLFSFRTSPPCLLHVRRPLSTVRWSRRMSLAFLQLLQVSIVLLIALFFTLK